MKFVNFLILYFIRTLTGQYVLNSNLIVATG